MGIQLWLNVSGLTVTALCPTLTIAGYQLKLNFGNVVTVEYIKVIKISLFLTFSLHRRMKSITQLSSCLFQGYLNSPHSPDPQKTCMWVPDLFQSLFFDVSGHTAFCGCPGFTCAVVQRAEPLPPLTRHRSPNNSASACIGFSCQQHHWLVLVLHFHM